jgi:cytochrome d ubiquinol oxidase subunit II
MTSSSVANDGGGVGNPAVGHLTINQAAGAQSTLAALLVVVALAAAIVLPALSYLFRLTQSAQWSRAIDTN